MKAEELAGAFTKAVAQQRLPSTVAVIGRWTEEEFLAILQADQTEAAALGRKKLFSDNLKGAYACLEGWGRASVRLALHLVGLDYWTRDRMTRSGLLQRIAEFLNAV